MKHKSALYIGLCAAIVGASLGFVFPAFSPLRVLWYYPLQHRWALEIRPTALAMDWYGRALLSCFAGGISGMVAGIIVRRTRQLSERTFGLWAAWAATAVIFAMGAYTYQLAMRNPTPEPLPPWYVPK